MRAYRLFSTSYTRLRQSAVENTRHAYTAANKGVASSAAHDMSARVHASRVVEISAPASDPVGLAGSAAVAIEIIEMPSSNGVADANKSGGGYWSSLDAGIDV